MQLVVKMLKDSIDKTKRTIRKGVEKVQQFRKSPKGQLLERLTKSTALNIARQSGLGQKVNDALNQKLAPYTEKSVPLDSLRKIIHASNHFYFQPQQPLAAPKYNYGKFTTMAPRKRPRIK
jgi:hypothetical protein